MILRYFNVDFYPDFNSSDSIDECLKYAIVKLSYYYSSKDELDGHVEKMKSEGYGYIVSSEGQKSSNGMEWIDHPYVNYTKKIYGDEIQKVEEYLKGLEEIK